MRSLFQFLFTTSFLLVIVGCNSSGNNTLTLNSGSGENTSESNTTELSEEFKAYWYSGKAEITSYDLSQERYGELREGTAVTVFVTEDFLPEVQVKANRSSEENVPVMKLNTTKKYLTGIYPYSVMTSVFSPVQKNDHAIKMAHSIQEWCGQVYIQLNNKNDFEVTAHSYFEGEADQKFNLSKTWLESELWNKIRINPESLPTNEFDILPSFEYFRMSHQKIEPHRAAGNLVVGDSISVYTLSYTDLKRELKIYFDSKFPFTIEQWEETSKNGLTTTARKRKRIKTDYWNKNGNEDGVLRKSLGL